MDENYKVHERQSFRMTGEDDDGFSADDVDSMDVQSRTEDSLTSDLQFQEQLHRVVSSVPSSRKRTKKTPSAQQGLSDTDPRSRARPRKPNEPSPFLSIDNLPVDKLMDDPQAFARQTPSRGGSSKQGTRPPINTPTPQTRGTTPITQLRSASSGSWNTAVPKKHRNVPSAVRRGNPPNHQVKAPFKHSVSKKPVAQAKVAPDQSLKEQTAMATVAVAKAMARQKPTRDKLIEGKLLKAKLKPLNVVKVEGPSMDKCRGIVAGSKVNMSDAEKERTKPVIYRDRKPAAIPVEPPKALTWDPWGLDNKETRSYDSSPSKTLQRRRQILNTIAQDYMYERPQTMESLHRTSIASDLTEDREKELKDDLNHAADILNNDAEQMSPMRGGVHEPPNTIATMSNPNSQFTAASMNHIGGTPSLGPSELPTTTPVDEEEGNYAGSQSPDDVPADAADANKKAQHDLTPIEIPDGGMDSQQSGGTPEQTAPVPETSPLEQPKLPAPEVAVPRGASASTIRAEEFAISLEEVEHQNRPRSVTDPNQRKEVRFAGVNEEDPETERPSDEEEADKKNSGGSCKDEAGKDRGRKEGDDDQDGEGGPCRGGSAGSRKGPRRVGSGTGSRSGSRQGSAGSRGQRKGSGKQNSYSTGGSFMINGQDDEVDRKKKPQYRKPKTQHWTWGSSMKPDEDITGLSIEGVRQSWYEREGSDDDSGIGGMNNAVVNFNLGVRRPNTACALNGRRPQSGRRTPGVSHSEYMMMAQERMKAREVDEGKKVRPWSARPASAKRTDPGARKTGFNRPTSATRRVRSAGPTRKQAKSGKRCSYCGNATSSTISYHQGIYFSVCDSCSNQAGKVSCNTYSLESMNSSGQMDQLLPNANNQLILASNAVLAAPSSDTDASTIIESIGTEDSDLMNNLDNLEQSLSQVQGEIRGCIEQSNKSSVDGESEPEPSERESVLSSSQQEMTSSPPTPSYGPTQGAFSDMYQQAPPPRPGGFAYRLTVYQFNESNEDEGLGVESANGDIESYDVTMMDEKDASAVKAEKEAEGAALLQMLCKQLEQSSVEPKESKPMEKKETTPLEVVAETKPITKSVMNESSFDPVASIAPLCFRINARPPRGSLYYFAYGLDMNPTRFGNYIKRQSEERFWGLLYGFRLAFNKKGLDSGNTGFPNILYDQGSSVEGCLYLISPAELDHLDKCMGYPQHYEHVMLPVWLINCNDPDDLGVAQYCVPALMYIARDLWIHTGPDAIDNSYAVDQCMKAGDLLSTSYKAQMAGMTQFGSTAPI